MKQIVGIWLPNTTTHLEPLLRENPLFEGCGTYQLAQIEAALRWTDERITFIDVGAYVGFWSRVMARYFTDVMAFEPVVECARCFQSNTSQYDNIILHHYALGASNKRVRIAVDPNNPERSHIANTGRPVIQCTLDSFSYFGVSLIKISVEGYEAEVLKGAEQTVKNNTPTIVVEQKQNKDAIELLKTWGYEVVWESEGYYCLKYK